MTNINQATDAELFAELDKCKVANVLLSKAAFKKQWAAYQVAIKAEITNLNSQLAALTDDELLQKLYA